ncbi:MAG: hypothetical protein ABH879_07375 [archaeon]
MRSRTSGDDAGTPNREPEQNGTSYKPAEQPSELSEEDQDFLAQIMGRSRTSGGGSGRPPRQPDDQLNYQSQLRQRKEALERDIGIPIDVDTYGNGSLTLFEHDAAIDSFRKATSQLQVDPRYMKGFVVVDQNLQPTDARTAELLSALDTLSTIGL